MCFHDCTSFFFAVAKDERDAVLFKELVVPASNPSTFVNLPRKWLIPSHNVHIVCLDDEPIVLGRGGFGIVYRARIRGSEEAAIKIVKGGGPEEQARLLHEITILDLCKSRHIVQFLGYSLAASDLLLCMEYMSRGTLYQSLQTCDEFQWHNR